MADDNSARSRTVDPFAGGPSPAPANDPLAELARLIGRSDPFSDYGSRPAAASQPVYPAAQAPAHPSSDAGNPSYGHLPPPSFGADPPSFLSQPAPQYSEPASQWEALRQEFRQEPRFEPPPPEPPRYSEPAPLPPQLHLPVPQIPEPAPRFNSEFPAHNDWPGSPPPPPASSYSVHDAFAQQPYADPAPRYDNQGYGAANYAPPPMAEPHGRFEQPGFEQQPYAAHAGHDHHHGYGAPFPRDPDTGGMPPPSEDEFYDEEPRGNRRRGMLTVVAVLGLAVLGTAGAFGYRSMFGGPTSSAPPPVIRASGEPSKVAPPPAAVDPSAGKFSYDRFGDAGKDEQVVRREERPVDLAKAAQPRTVLPGAPVVSNSPTSRTPAPAVTAGGNPPSAIGEPRRVRTVPIRPDGESASAGPAQQPATVVPPRQTNANASAPPPPATVTESQQRASSRVAMRQPAAAAPAANAPLSLSPDGNPPPPPVQDFPPAPRASAPPPARAASAPAASGGGYLVQVSSQRSEAEAANAYRGLQAKYSGVLGSQPHQVRRADLGSKGVYYRAMVGPFGSREEAVQLCSSLKQAGGDCVVQQ